MKRWNSLGYLFCLLLLVMVGWAQDTKPVRLLISGGGDWHPYGQGSGALIDALRASGGFVCSYSEDPQALHYEHLKHFDVLMIYNGVFYEGEEGGQKVPTPGYIPEGIQRFVQEGGGLVCVHSAVASFSDWPGFQDLIGGIWIWKKSKHDAYGPLKSDVVKPDHPVVQGLPATFTFPDEFYHTLDILPGVEVLIESTHEKNGEMVTEPLVWIAKDTTQERVITVLHGHDMGSWGTAELQTLMRNALEWAARKR